MNKEKSKKPKRVRRPRGTSHACIFGDLIWVEYNSGSPSMGFPYSNANAKKLRDWLSKAIDYLESRE